MKKNLAIIGGGLRYDNDKVFNRLIELAGGKDNAKIVVIPLASNRPKLYGQIIKNTFKSFGIDAELMLIGNCERLNNYEAAVFDRSFIEMIDNSTGIFFTGGHQHKISEALFQKPDYKPTPMLEAIWRLQKKGGLISGTSAGASIMNTIMFKDGNSYDVLLGGAKKSGLLCKGLGFIGPETYIEQHFFDRGRFGRMLVAMMENGYKLGFGISADTCLNTEDDGWLKVIGYNGVIVIDLSEAYTDKYNNTKMFNLHNGKISYIDRNDKYNMYTKKVIYSDYKLNGIKIDPNSKNFVPYNNRERFYPDIHADNSLKTLLWDFIDNDQKEVVGLSFKHNTFDGNDNADKNINYGFEFRFKKGKESLGYYSGVLGSEDYSVTNVYFDVHPIKLNGKLYDYA